MIRVWFKFDLMLRLLLAAFECDTRRCDCVSRGTFAAKTVAVLWPGTSRAAVGKGGEIKRQVGGLICISLCPSLCLCLRLCLCLCLCLSVTYKTHTGHTPLHGTVN